MKQERKGKNRNVVIGAAILALLVIIGGGFAVVNAQAVMAENAKLAQLEELNKNLSYALEDAERYATELSSGSVSSTEGMKGVSADLDRIEAKITDAENLIADGKALIATMKPIGYTEKVSAAYVEYEQALKGYHDTMAEMRKFVAYSEKMSAIIADAELLENGMYTLELETDPVAIRNEIADQQQAVAHIKQSISEANAVMSFGTEEEWMAYMDNYSKFLDAFGRAMDATDAGTFESAYDDVLTYAKALVNPPSSDQYGQNIDKWMNNTLKPVAQQADEHCVSGDRLMEEAKQL
jgi:hypothetical protein